MSAPSSFDELTRRALLAIGVLALAVGTVTYIVVHPLVDVLPSSFALPVVTGGLALLTGLWLLRARTTSDTVQITPPDVERPVATDPPGSDVDQALYRLTRFRENTVEYRNRIQERLASVAVDVIRLRDGCSRAAAVTKLNEGTWTDNPYASSFFAGGSPPTQSLLDTLTDRFRGKRESDYERWVRLTVDELVSRAGVEATATDDTPANESDDEPVGLIETVRAQFGQSSVPSSSAKSYQDVTQNPDAERVTENVTYGRLVETGHWRGITAFALIAAGWGVLTTTPSVFLLSVIAVGLTGYARTRIEPDVSSLEVERQLSESVPEPGEEVVVTVTVHNTGDSFLPDLRLIDRVPPAMSVIEGSPRLATTLGADATATFEYTTVAERGVHEWPLLVYGRDVTGAIEREAAIDVAATMECVPTLAYTHDTPVRSQTSLFSGQVDTSRGGSGLEFFQMREYREGDPMKRIDWKRRARTGELATIDFRQEKAAKVVLLFDARESAYVSPEPDARHAVDRSVDAATELFAALHDRGDLVGVAAFDTVPCWLGPGAGESHRERARRLFAEHSAIASIPPALKDVGGEYVDPMTHIRRQLDPESQIMLFSPLCDDYTTEVARRLDSMGHPITIVSPDPTSDGSIGQRLARLDRTTRIVNLREKGIRVLNWQPEDMLGIELKRARERWTA